MEQNQTLQQTPTSSQIPHPQDSGPCQIVGDASRNSHIRHCGRPRWRLRRDRTYRKAEDKIRRQTGGNILNKIPVLQNEPTGLDLSALDATSDANRDFHRTQRTHGSSGLVAGYSGYKLGIGECNYIHYGLTADYLRETPGDYAAKRTGLAELHRAPHLTEKLQNERNRQNKL
jgi:hypothetical protein